MEGEIVNLLIVGAAGAVGRAAGRRMAPRAQIVAADRDGEAAREFEAELKAAGHRCRAYEVDATRRDSVASLFEGIARDVGPIHALIYAAGIYRSRSVEAISEADWDAMIATHAKGAYLCAQAVLPQMRDRGAGAIVTVASDCSVTGLADNVAYAAAMSALYSLSKSLAQAFARSGVRVNAIGPGAIESPMLRGDEPQESSGQLKAQRAERVPMGRLGKPDEVAAVVDFLLGERSAYLTGQIVHVNGGELVW
jgi:NAD(P)-dependent dehydrogenase (short-subunit alcohol dehydrogenase family)